jgi:phospholipase C
VVSPWAKTNFVDHTLTDQSSVIAFIEDNWQLGRLGEGYGDAFAGSVANMFDFTKKEDEEKSKKVILDPTTGEVVNKDTED